MKESDVASFSSSWNPFDACISIIVSYGLSYDCSSLGIYGEK